MPLWISISGDAVRWQMIEWFQSCVDRKSAYSAALIFLLLFICYSAGCPNKTSNDTLTNIPVDQFQNSCAVRFLSKLLTLYAHIVRGVSMKRRVTRASVCLINRHSTAAVACGEFAAEHPADRPTGDIDCCTSRLQQTRCARRRAAARMRLLLPVF